MVQRESSSGRRGSAESCAAQGAQSKQQHLSRSQRHLRAGVHDCCQQQVLLVDLSEDFSACYCNLCLLSQTLPAIPNCLKCCLLCQTLPAIPNFACYAKLCLLSQTLPAIPNFAYYAKLCLLSQTSCLKLGALTTQSDAWQQRITT